MSNVQGVKYVDTDITVLISPLQQRQIASIHGTPKPLAASSSINPFKSPQQEHSPLERSSQSSLDESVSDDEEAVEVKCVLKQHGFFAQLEEEQKVNIEVTRILTLLISQSIVVQR